MYRDTLARFFATMPALRAKRDAVQARRRRRDSEIVPLFVEPLRPSFFGRAYWREQARVVRAFDIARIFENASMDDFIEQLEGRIEELEAELAAARVAADEHAAERARLAAEIARLRAELGRGGG